MQPSSLIFLILIAIWAAYLLQHWVRRREHLATARSVDRFSDAMRVLQRRNSVPEVDKSAPDPRSYAISPARPSRQEVIVKRAQPPRPEGPTVPAGAVRSTRTFHVLAGLSARRVRGLSLFASLSLVLVVSALAAFSVLPWWSMLVALAALMGDIAWLRHVAVSERGTDRARGQVPESAAGSARPSARRSAESESEAKPESEEASEQGPLVEAPAPGESERTEPIESPAEVDPSSWAPIPVPPPTYTLKAKAAEPVTDTVPVAVDEPAVAGSWSLDGMVYDCELDELVQRHSATGA